MRIFYSAKLNLLVLCLAGLCITNVFAQGTSCATAITASLGDNLLPVTSSSQFESVWYKFTMPSEPKRIRIATSANEKVVLYAGPVCVGSQIKYKEDGNLMEGSLQPNQEVTIRWEVGGGGNFIWNLTVEDHQEGDNCDIPKTAVLGENVMPVEVGRNYHYTFTMPNESGKTLVLSGEEPDYVVVTNGCNVYSGQSGRGGVRATRLSPGEQVSIIWQGLYEGFNWSLAVEDEAPGDHCLVPATAVVGINHVPETLGSSYLYSFTMPQGARKKLVVSSASTEAVRIGTCDQTFSSLADANLVLSEPNLAPGQTVFIRWDTWNDDDFDWTLSVEDIEPTDNYCGNPAEAVVGNNVTPAADQSFYWHSFTMPAGGKKLVIDADMQRSFKVLTGGCENFQEVAQSYMGDVIVTELEENETAFIQWDSNPVDFNWNLSVEDIGPGDNCANADQITHGQYNFTSDNKIPYWYKITTPNEERKRIVISSNASVGVGLYSSCGQQIVNGYGIGNLKLRDVEANQDIFIVWFPSTTNDFTWNLSFDDGGPGEKCETAVSASLGNNLLPASEPGQYQYWYKFTMPPQPKRIKITSSVTNGLQLYKSGCLGLGISFGSGNLVEGRLEPNEEVYIAWGVLPTSNFTWNLSLADLQPGDNCSNPAQAVLGANTVPADVGDNYIYTFTMPNEVGKTLVISSSTTGSVVVHTASCSSDPAQGGFNGDARAVGLSPNQQVYIRWYYEADFTWNLSVEDEAPGDRCSIPAQAIEGTNHVPSTFGSGYWYKFTMPNDPGKKLVIASSSSNWVYIYHITCDPSVADYQAHAWGRENAFDPNLAPGQEVFIRWNTFEQDDFDWSLTVEDLEPTDNYCENPTTAVLGLNHVPLSSQTIRWFSFTMPSQPNKKLVIDRNGSESFVIQTNDCENPTVLATSNSGKATATNVQPNQTVIIKWKEFESGNFDWNLSVEDLVLGDNCEYADEITSGQHNFTSDLKTPYWYSIVTPNVTGKRLVVNSTSNVNLRVYASCGQQLASGYENLSVVNMPANQEVFVVWLPNNTNDFSWELSFDNGEPGLGCVGAVPAGQGANQVPAVGQYQFEYWYKFTMPNLPDKKLVITFPPTETVNFYGESCSSEIGAYGADGRKEVLDLEPGQQVLIKWFTFMHGNFSWNLAVEDLVPGDKCDLPINASLGANHLPGVLPGFSNWYSFQMPDEAGKTLSFYFPESLVFVAFSGECENMEFITYSETGEAEIPDAPAGSLLVFFFALKSSAEAGDFDWQLDVVDPLPGETCSLPLAASNGVNHAPTAPVWYKYTAAASGQLTISSLGSTINTDLWVYDQCNGTELASNDDFESTLQSQVSINVTFGDELLIKWSGTHGSGAFDFTVGLRQSQAIVFNDLDSKTFGDAAFELSASSSADLPVAFESSNPQVAFMEGTRVNILSAGETFITATQPGNESFLPAEAVVRKLVVDKATQSITFLEIAQKTMLSEPFELEATASSALPIQFEVSDGQIVRIDGGQLIILNAGTVTIKASQSGNNNYKAAEPIERTLVVSKVQQVISFTTIPDKTLGDGAFTLNAIASSNLEVIFETQSDKISIEDKRVNLLNAGLVSIVAAQPGTSIYAAAASVENSFCVNPPKPTITSQIADGEIVLTSSAPEGNEWYRDGERMPGANGNTYLTDAAGVYSVKVTVDLCESEMSERETVVITGFENLDSMLIYPNPVKDVLSIDIERGQFSKIEVVSLLNQVLLSQEGYGPQLVNLEFLSEGGYILRVETEGLAYIKRLVKK